MDVRRRVVQVWRGFSGYSSGWSGMAKGFITTIRVVRGWTGLLRYGVGMVGVGLGRQSLHTELFRDVK